MASALLGFAALAAFFSLGLLGIGTVLGRFRVLSTTDGALCFGLGLSFFTWSSGILYLAGWGNIGLQSALLTIGCVACIWSLFKRRMLLSLRGLSTVFTLPAFYDFTLFVLPFLAIVLKAFELGSLFHFNSHDDFQAYLVFPQRMAMIGAMPFDPFSERLLSSGFWGFWTIQSWFFSKLGPMGAYVLDSFVFFPALFTAVISATKTSWRSRVAIACCSWILVTFVFSLESIRLNTSAYWASAFFFGLLLRAYVFRLPMNPGVLGVFAASGILFKNTSVPWVILAAIGALSVTLAENRKARETVRQLVFSVGLGVVVLAPWMFASWKNAQTLWFPVFKTAFHASMTEPDWSPWHALNATTIEETFRGILGLTPLRMMWVLLPLCFTVTSRSFAVRASWTALGGTAAALLIGLMSGGTYWDRFNLPFLFATAGVVLTGVLSMIRIRRPAWHVGIGSVAVIFVYSQVRAFHPRVALDNLTYTLGVIRRSQEAWDRSSAGQPGTQPTAQAHDTRARQLARLTGQDPSRRDRILVRITDPYRLDFRSADFLVPDWPGGASPPPGMRAQNTIEDLLAYARTQKIGKIIYECVGQAGFAAEDYSGRLSAQEHPWIRMMARDTLAFQALLDAFCKTSDRRQAIKPARSEDIFETFREGPFLLLRLLSP